MKHLKNTNCCYLTAIGAITVAFSLLCTGCSSPRGVLFPPLEPKLVWPSPPEEARVMFVGTLSTEKDLKKEISWSEGFGELVFGKKEMGFMVGPYSIAVDDKSRIYVADTAAGLVQVFDLIEREYRQFDAMSDDKSLQMPISLALIDEKIYVVDSELRQVSVFDLDGKHIFSFGSNHLKRPSGIAYSPAKDIIFIADAASHTIYLFDKKGELLGTMGKRGTEPGEFNYPTHLCVDNNGLLYVSDTLNYRIQIFDADGKFIRMFGQHGDRPGYFAHPCGIAVDMQGHIFVTDRQFENVQIFDSNGQILLAFGQEGSGYGQFWLPAGIFIDRKNRIYVADSFNKRVQVFELLELDQNEN